MLTPYSLQKTFQSGISPLKQRKLVGEGCSAMQDLEPFGGTLRPLLFNETQVKLDETEWLIAPILLAEVYGVKVYFGKEHDDDHPKIFIFGAGSAITDLVELADTATLPMGCAFSDDLLDVVFTDKTLMRIEVTNTAGTITFDPADAVLADYATCLAMFRNRPVIGSPGDGLLTAFDAYFELFLNSMGVTTYSLYGETLTLSGLMPDEARKRTVLWGGLYGAPIKTLEDPVKYLIGQDVDTTHVHLAGLTTYTATLSAGPYILAYDRPSGPSDFLITVTHVETAKVAYTATLSATIAEKLAFLPVLPYDGVYTIEMTDFALLTSLKPNYLEAFMKRVDWGYVTLPASAGDILNILALNDHIIVVCQDSVYRLTPLPTTPSFSIVKMADMQSKALTTIHQQTNGNLGVLINLNDEFYVVSNKPSIEYLLYPSFTVAGSRIISTSEEIAITPATGHTHLIRGGVHMTTVSRKFAPGLYGNTVLTTRLVASLDSNLGIPGQKRLERIQVIGFGAWHVRVWVRPTSVLGTRTLVLDRDITMNDYVECSMVGECFLVEVSGVSSGEFSLEDVVLWWRQPGRTRQDARPGNQWFR